MLKCSLTTQQCPFHTFTVILTLSGFYLEYVWTEFSRFPCPNSESLVSECNSSKYLSWWLVHKWKNINTQAGELRRSETFWWCETDRSRGRECIQLSTCIHALQHLEARPMQVFLCYLLHVWIDRWEKIPDLILQRSASVCVKGAHDLYKWKHAARVIHADTTMENTACFSITYLFSLQLYHSVQRRKNRSWRKEGKIIFLWRRKQTIMKMAELIKK